jgi:hypothetical protein
MNTIIRRLSTKATKMTDKVEWNKTRKAFVLSLPNKGMLIMLLNICINSIVS